MSEPELRYPLHITYSCSGCGHEFGRTGEGWLSHPLPWCGPFIGGQYQPVPTATS